MVIQILRNIKIVNYGIPYNMEHYNGKLWYSKYYGTLKW
jgi:hypothetical protein